MKKEDCYNDKIDIIKGFAIFTVVYGHTIQYGSGAAVLNSGAFFEDILFKIIYSFHMPLFILISGYLFRISVERHSFKKILISRFTTLIIPILAWSMIPYIIALSQMELSVFSVLRKFLGTIVREYWFLWAIFYCSMVVLIVNRFFKDSPIIHLMGLIVALFIPDIYNFHLYKYMYPFFLIGYFYNKYSKNFIKTIYNFSQKRGILFGLCLIYVLMLAFYNRNIYIYISRFSLLGKNWIEQLGIDIYRTIIGLLGCAIVIGIIDIIYSEEFRNKMGWLSYIGSKSLGIYIISGLIFTYILPRLMSQMKQINYIYSLIQTSLIIAISLSVTVIIQKKPFLNKILFGGRSQK